MPTFDWMDLYLAAQVVWNVIIGGIIILSHVYNLTRVQLCVCVCHIVGKRSPRGGAANYRCECLSDYCLCVCVRAHARACVWLTGGYLCCFHSVFVLIPQVLMPVAVTQPWAHRHTQCLLFIQLSHLKSLFTDRKCFFLKGLTFATSCHELFRQIGWNGFLFHFSDQQRCVI